LDNRPHQLRAAGPQEELLEKTRANPELAWNTPGLDWQTQPLRMQVGTAEVLRL